MTKRILIIDDEDSIREIMLACVEDLGGWRAISAASGKEGLLKSTVEQPDAIVLDISMPDLDGFQLLGQLQVNPLTQAIPVILLTAKVLPRDRARFATLNVAGVITKPFNPVTICEQIATILGWHL